MNELAQAAAAATGSMMMAPMFQPKKPTCYQLFNALARGFRPQPRSVVIGILEDGDTRVMPVRHLEAMQERPKHDGLGERIRRTRQKLRLVLKGGAKDSHYYDELAVLEDEMAARRAGNPTEGFEC